MTETNRLFPPTIICWLVFSMAKFAADIEATGGVSKTSFAFLVIGRRKQLAPTRMRAIMAKSFIRKGFLTVDKNNGTISAKGIKLKSAGLSI